ncbi:MAG: hypothetical protein KJZ81_07830 [Burkholderiaceae bacterium]|nr:hypothetical protein [Burkholderiaceae bacterium]
MSDAAVILDELRELRRLVEALLPPPLDRRQQDLLDALGAVFGASSFSAAEVLTVAATPMADRRRLRAAIEAVGASDAQRLGMTLAALEKRSRGRATRLERVGSEGGSRLWGITGA